MFLLEPELKRNTTTTAILNVLNGGNYQASAGGGRLAYELG